MITIILLFTAHYLDDFTPLNRPYMLKAKSFSEPTGPILDHAIVHGLLVFVVIWLMGYCFSIAVVCLVIEASSHFVIDLMKGKVNYWFPSVRNSNSQWYWAIFGFDQLLHTIILIFIAKICNIV